MIDHINANREVHIVTIEDPIEVLHHDKLAMINQREVRVDTEDFSVALRAAMRQDPDVILVGEMRDTETVKAALAAAETGHFVMSTLHTTDARGDHQPHHRLLPAARAEAGPPRARRRAARHHLPAARARAPTARAAASRWRSCVNTGRIADAIADPDKTSTIHQLIGEGGYYGMQTFDQHLVALIRDGVITLEAAMARLDQPARPHGRAAPPRPRRLAPSHHERSHPPAGSARWVTGVGGVRVAVRSRSEPAIGGRVNVAAADRVGDAVVHGAGASRAEQDEPRDCEDQEDQQQDRHGRNHALRRYPADSGSTAHFHRHPAKPVPHSWTCSKTSSCSPCPGVAPFELGVVCEVFGIDRSDSGLPTYDFAVVGLEAGKPVPTGYNGGLTVVPSYGLERVDHRRPRRRARTPLRTSRCRRACWTPCAGPSSAARGC